MLTTKILRKKYGCFGDARVDKNFEMGSTTDGWHKRPVIEGGTEREGSFSFLYFLILSLRRVSPLVRQASLFVQFQIHQVINDGNNIKGVNQSAKLIRLYQSNKHRKHVEYRI